MIESIKNWLKARFSADEPSAKTGLNATGVHRQPGHFKTRRREEPDVKVDSDEDLSGEIESLGPGKNVLIRNKYVREDTGTHETLKILDDSLVDSGEETGIDPYNTGGFDRSKNWDTRFRK